MARNAVVPSAPIAAPGSGLATTVWLQFFNLFVAPAAAIAGVTLSASPARLTASASGSFAVSGGTVSGITLTRNTMIVPTGVTSGLIPVANGDVLTITYSGAPTVNFIPS